MPHQNQSKEDDERILNAFKMNPELKECILEMIEITEDPTRGQKLRLLDDAEEAVVEVIHKTGKTILKDWAQKCSDEAAEDVSKKTQHRPHGKKN